MVVLIVNARFLLLKKYFTIAEWFNQFYTSTQNHLTVHYINVLVVILAHKKFHLDEDVKTWTKSLTIQEDVFDVDDSNYGDVDDNNV